MKRSASIIIVAAGVALSACSESPDTFSSVQDCMSSGKKTLSECSTSFAEAKKEHAQSAPKFTSKEQCEAQYGAGKCEKPPEAQQPAGATPAPTTAGSSGGSSVSDMFMPAMMGYMVGSMMANSSGAAAAAASRPVYYDREGRTYSGGTPVAAKPSSSFSSRSPTTSSATSSTSRSYGGTYGGTARGMSSSGG